ncbi:LysR substrate-binding domain-containing protein [Marinomonas ostreistagni]|uniref:LysR substrate-binding domain-containing protein n=1 Tax=Marinomonas ostreistagni TaxID=359209 RepID=UPI0019505E17|nr:LysR substrate-binding domain-containing protein [Marinomonas ostreistagni]MBM6550815.1 LysR family transcriptional regulator [Marinomonas ostreistagni]
MFHWEGIAEFVTVADEASFTAAAKILDISTAQVSRKLTALEQRLGAKLVRRTTRHVSLTDVGIIYYQHCKQLLQGLEQADQAVINMSGVLTGHLKVTAASTYGEKRIAPLINDFMALHEQLTIELVLSNERLDLVRDGFDLAIRLGKLEDSSMIAKKLDTRVQHLCATPAYLEKYGTPTQLSQLQHHNCLLGSTDYWRFCHGGKHHKLHPKGTISCNNGNALLDATLKGMGLAQLPDYYVQDYLDRGELVTVLDEYREPEDGIWAVYPYSQYPSPKVTQLVDFLKHAM